MQPTNLSIDDSATSQGSINFFNNGDLTLNGMQTFATTSYGSTQIGASGTLSVIGSISGYDLNLGGATINVYGGYAFAANNIQLTASTISVSNGGYVGAGNNAALVTPLLSGTINLAYGGGVVAGATGTPSSINGIPYTGIAFVAQNLSGDSGGYMDAMGVNGNISGLVSGNVTLRNGAGLIAGDDITVVLAGGDSMVQLFSGGKFVSDVDTGVAGTIYLDFLTRSSGGIMIDGTATTTSSPGAAASSWSTGYSGNRGSQNAGDHLRQRHHHHRGSLRQQPGPVQPPLPIDNPVIDVVEGTPAPPRRTRPSARRSRRARKRKKKETVSETRTAMKNQARKSCLVQHLTRRPA